MTVPKKSTSVSKKRIRKNIWKRKGYCASLKVFFLEKFKSGSWHMVNLYCMRSFFLEKKLI